METRAELIETYFRYLCNAASERQRYASGKWRIMEIPPLSMHRWYLQEAREIRLRLAAM